MTAPADTTSRLVDADARALADRAASLALTVSAWASLLAFGGVCAFVVFVAVAR